MLNASRNHKLFIKALQRSCFQAGGREGGKGGAEGAEGNFTWGRNWSNVLIPMKVRHWRWGGRGREGGGEGGRGEGGGGKGGAEGAEGTFTWGRNWSNVLIPMKVRHWRGGGREGGRARAGQRDGRKFYLGGRIDQMCWSQWRWGIEEGAVERGGRGREGWKGGEGQGRGGGRKFYLGGGIDQMHWSKWRWGIE